MQRERTLQCTPDSIFTKCATEGPKRKITSSIYFVFTIKKMHKSRNDPSMTSRLHIYKMRLENQKRKSEAQMRLGSAK